jgi:hypothetical protein
MAHETIVAAFETPDHAEAAVDALRAGGFANADISVFHEDLLKGGEEGHPSKIDDAAFWQEVFGSDVHRHEARVYKHVLEHGGVIVAARVPETETAHAIAVLDVHSPVDVHDRALTLGLGQPSHIEAIAKRLNSLGLAAGQKVGVPASFAEAHHEVQRLAEDLVQVGKKLASEGKSRVRRFVKDHPIPSGKSLQDYHAEIIRRNIAGTELSLTKWADEEVKAAKSFKDDLARRTARISKELAAARGGAEIGGTLKDRIGRQTSAIWHGIKKQGGGAGAKTRSKS